jgi:hypothetical protein
MDAEAWRGPGIYTFTAAISDFDGDIGAFVEFPLKLRVIIDGPSPAGPVGPGPLGALPAAAAEDPDVKRAAGNGRTRAVDEDEPGAVISDVGLVIAAAVALMGGVGLGIVAMRLRSRVRRVSTR